MIDSSGQVLQRQNLEHCLVIANPAAGTISPQTVAEVVGRCERHAPTELAWTDGPGDASRLAADAARRAAAGHGPTSASARIVVAVGGDGTVAEVVRGLLSPEAAGGAPALCIVPAGTGNSNYRALWGTRPWPAALTQALTTWPTGRRAIDLAHIRELDEPVLLGVGAGLTAEVLRSAKTVPATGAERLATGLEHAAARFSAYQGRVTVDEAVVHEGGTVCVNIGGGRHRAWQYLVLPDSRLDDGLLDVCVVGAALEPTRLPELLRTGKHLGQPGVVYRRGRRVVVERLDGDPLCFEHDGELMPAATVRLTVDVRPGALVVLCDPAVVGPLPGDAR